MDYKYDSTLGYPCNKPISRCCIDGVKSDVLLDNGAYTSVFAILWSVKNIKGPHLYQLDTAVACYLYDKNPDLWYNSATEVWKSVAVIRDVVYDKFKCLYYQFHILVHAHPDDILVFILGNECISLMDTATNVATSTIRMPRFVGLLNAQEKYQVFTQQAEKAAGEYLNIKFSMLTACRTSTINTRGIPFRKERIRTPNILNFLVLS